MGWMWIATALGAITGDGVPVARTVVSDLVAPSLCEASAAVVAPWAPELVLVADNEIDDRLFAFAVEGGQLEFRALVPLSGGSRPRDVEALAALEGGVVAVGSHSDSKRGEVKPKRSRIGFYAPSSKEGPLRLVRSLENAGAMATARRDVSACLTLLFSSPAPARARELCAALRSEPPQFEGAIALPGAGRGVPRLWLGLRAPLVDGRALLLRLVEGPGEFRFDAIVPVDLGGLGIRELAAIDGRLFGIAGPGDDRRGSFRLLELPLPSAEGGGTIEVRWHGDLPDGSEGLVPVVGGAIALVDVNRPGGGESPCPGSAKQMFVPLRRVEEKEAGAAGAE